MAWAGRQEPAAANFISPGAGAAASLARAQHFPVALRRESAMGPGVWVHTRRLGCWLRWLIFYTYGP